MTTGAGATTAGASPVLELVPMHRSLLALWACGAVARARSSFTRSSRGLRAAVGERPILLDWMHAVVESMVSDRHDGELGDVLGAALLL